MILVYFHEKSTCRDCYIYSSQNHNLLIRNESSCTLGAFWPCYLITFFFSCHGPTFALTFILVFSFVSLFIFNIQLLLYFLALTLQNFFFLIFQVFSFSKKLIDIICLLYLALFILCFFLKIENPVWILDYIHTLFLKNPPLLGHTTLSTSVGLHSCF